MGLDSRLGDRYFQSVKRCGEIFNDGLHSSVEQDFPTELLTQQYASLSNTL